MTPEEQAREALQCTPHDPCADDNTCQNHRVLAAALATKDAEIERLKAAYGALAPVAIELRTQRDALAALLETACNSVAPDRFGTGRPSWYDEARAALAAGKGEANARRSKD